MNTEERPLDEDTPLSTELAVDIITRVRFGKIIVVASEPNKLLPPARKRWMKELRRMQNKRSSTLDLQTIERYTKQISLMQQTSFTAKTPYEELFADVYFITPDTLPEFGLFGVTLYVTCPVNKSTLEDIARFMPDIGLVVVYRREEAK